MTTLADLYRTVDAKRATLVVTIAGVILTDVVSARWSFSIERVPTARIRVPFPAPGAAVFFADVRIDAGFDGVTTRVFTGKVVHVNPDERGVTIECVGQSWPLDMHYHKVIVSLSSTTAADAIASILSAAGVTATEVNVAAWTIATVEDVTLEFQTYAEAIEKIGEVDGNRWFEMPTGLLRVEPADPIPGLTVFRQYFSMVLTGLVESFPAGISSGRPRLQRIASRQQARETKNQAFVRGATVTQTNADGTEDSIDIEGDASAPSPWVLLPDGSDGFNDLLFANELIQTAVKAAEVAVRLVIVNNRLLTQITAVIAGDPEINLGQTVQIEDPSYSGTSGRWFVEGYETRWGANRVQTTLRLLGGQEAGSTPSVSPFALFSHVTEREVIGDREWAIVTLDGRGSFDPDGTIVSYSWTDNQGPPIVSGTDAVIMVRVDPATLSVPWEVTLTVTDNDGLTDDITLTIDITPSAADVFIPGIYVAFENNFSGSPDGGRTWNDQAGSGVISVGAKPGDAVSAGTAVFGTSTGQLYRTTDFCATAPTLVMAAVGSPIEHVHWDFNRTVDVVAITQDGRIYRSQDDGLTWALFDDLKVVLGLPSLRASRIATPSPDGYWVYGGEGNGQPLVAIDPARTHAWIKAAIGGELATDMAGAPTDLFIVEAASREEGELAIVLNSSTHTPAVYLTTDVLGDGSTWTRGIGVPPKSRGRWIAPDLEVGKFALAFDDNVTYVGDVAAGVITVSVAVATLDAGDAPNYGIWLGRFIIGLAGAYLVAAEGPADGTVYKTWDRFANVDKVRPATGFPAAPAGANAKQIGIGPQANVGAATIYAQESVRDTGTDTYARRFAKLDGNTWILQENPAAVDQQPISQVRRLGANLFRIAGSQKQGNFDGLHPGQLQRSTDDGQNWANVGPAPVVSAGNQWGINSMVRGADGTLWACACVNVLTGDAAFPAPRVYKSVDEGAIWTQEYEDSTKTSGFWRRFIDIAAHPLDKDIIATVGDAGVGLLNTWFTTDGSSFSRNTGGFVQVVTGNRRCVMMDNGRIVIMSGTSLGYSDDFGAVWVDSGESFATFTHEILRSSTIIFACGGGATTPVVKRSVDYGANWTDILDDSGMDAGTINVFLGLLHDTVNDILYVSTDTSNGLRFWSLHDARQTPVGSLVDLTLNLGAHFTDEIGLQGITF